jgi:hypothetical protein
VTDLARQIDEARANLERLERQASAATCAELGRHDWQSLGGCNAGCEDGCCCSVPVHKCARCGDCDYGENDWAIEVRRECAERRQWRGDQ